MGVLKYVCAVVLEDAVTGVLAGAERVRIIDLVHLTPHKLKRKKGTQVHCLRRA